MNRFRRPAVAHLFLLLLLPILIGVQRCGADDRCTVWLIGDSTVHNTVRTQRGWGDVFGKFLDPARARVQNRAIGGRSSRSFAEEGSWAKVVAELKPGDYVIIQFGHNDGGGLRQSPDRASLKGNGDESRDATNTKTGITAPVHSYGWYLRKYIAEAKAKGAVPVVCSPVPRNLWKNGKVGRTSDDYGKWAAEAAQQGGAVFVDLNESVAAEYEALGEAAVKAFFPDEHTHTNAAGAELNARCLAAELRRRTDCGLAALLAPQAP